MKATRNHINESVGVHVIAETEWVESVKDPGYRTKTLKLSNNATVEVLRPILSPDERAKREAEVVAVCGSALSNYYKRKESNS